MARRQIAMGNRAYDGTVDDVAGHWTGQLNFVGDALDAPLHWKKPSRIFVCSMGDIFHANSSIEWVRKVFGIFNACLQRGINHTFIILTKRPDNALDFFNVLPYGSGGRLWENVWLGVTVENQCHFDRVKMIKKCTGIEVKKKFISCEPLLGQIKLGPIIKKIDWVICGSESGPGARPMNPDWARSLRDQCQEYGVPFFLKQMTGVKPRQGELPALDGRIWGEFPK
jgi:protein gp37